MLRRVFRKVHGFVREHVGKIFLRSPEWPVVRHRWLGVHDECAACGGKTALQVHHKKPFHLYPDLELNSNNLMTLCMGPKDCHLHIGHGGDFRCYNPDVEKHAFLVRGQPDLWDHVVEGARTLRRSI